MRAVLLTLVCLLSACAPGTPGPLARLDALAGPVERRGAVELAVKSAHGPLLAQIEAGTGPDLVRVMDLAGIPPAERPARLTQLQGDLGLYAANPGALVAALLAYGRG